MVVVTTKAPGNERISMTDRIQKEVVLRAPLGRVWSALSDPAKFGAWFGAKLNGSFVAGSVTRGPITISGFDHLMLEMDVVSIEPERYFAYRWHPYAIDPKVDYSSEPTTLVEFRLEAVSEGTKLTISESGFDGIPAARRAEAFRMNDGGWSAQAENLTRYVAT
jgi:uncharacterized protein YndB with AHSA1/START domain